MGTCFAPCKCSHVLHSTVQSSAGSAREEAKARDETYIGKKADNATRALDATYEVWLGLMPPRKRRSESLLASQKSDSKSGVVRRRLGPLYPMTLMQI